MLVDFEQLICSTAGQVSFRCTSRCYNVKHVTLNTKIILKGHIRDSYFATIKFIWLCSSPTRLSIVSFVHKFAIYFIRLPFHFATA